MVAQGLRIDANKNFKKKFPNIGTLKQLQNMNDFLGNSKTRASWMRKEKIRDSSFCFGTQFPCLRWNKTFPVFSNLNVLLGWV